MEQKYDFFVVGLGLAGLTYAKKVSKYGKVCILSKTKLEEANTLYVQGGIAAVIYKPDIYEKHINDTIIAGGGLCKKNIVKMVVKEASQRINEIIEWGANFDKKKMVILSLQKKENTPKI